MSGRSIRLQFGWCRAQVEIATGETMEGVALVGELDGGARRRSSLRWMWIQCKARLKRQRLNVGSITYGSIINCGGLIAYLEVAGGTC